MITTFTPPDADGLRALPAAGRPAVMEGQGAYNRNVFRPAAAAALAVPLLEQAARMIDPGPDDRPLFIADYGSSQGRNSLRPMRAAITVLRERLGAERAIRVTHTDLPDNDFNSLFRMLRDDPDSYLHDQPNVFADAVGRSFYQSLLPPAQVSLGWSSYAACWLSRVPALIPGHFHDLRATGAAREAFDAQAAADWLTFLSLRALELRPTARLVILLPAVDEAGFQAAGTIFDAGNDSIAELVDRGIISANERERMVAPGRLRSRTQLLAPFASGAFAGLTVEHCEVSEVPEAAWDVFRVHGDAHMLATQRARFFRAVFAPVLTVALEPTRTPAARVAFADALEETLVRRLSVELREIPSTSAVMVVARQG
jgi:SAM dependent carboxyl methyltransferase